MVQFYSHEDVCCAKVAYLHVEGLTHTKDNAKIFEIEVVRNSSTKYFIKKNLTELQTFMKEIKSIARKTFLHKAEKLQSRIKKLIAKDEVGMLLKQLEKLLNELVLIEAINQSKLLHTFAKPASWDCDVCSKICQESNSKLDTKPVRNDFAISQPFQFPKYKVLRNTNLPENLKQPIPEIGEIVEVYQKFETGWWYVVYANKLICFPCTYMESLDPEGDVENEAPMLEIPEQFFARKAYKARAEDEISFEIHDPVLVLQKKMSGWWLAETAGRRGLAPAIFLEQQVPKETGEVVNCAFETEEGSVKIEMNVK